MKKKLSGGTRAFWIFGIILFGLFLLFTILSLSTSNIAVEKITKKYVDDIKINDTYNDRLMKYGFTKEECNAFFNGDDLKDILASVMMEEVNALFKNTDSFAYTKEKSKEDILDALRSIHADADESLAVYVMDVTGVSSLYIYETPQQYKEAVLGGSGGDTDINLDRTILNALATLSDPIFPIMLFLMYAVCETILIVICNVKEKRWVVALDTALYPSLLCEAYFIVMTFGEKGSDALHKGIYLVGNVVGVIGIVFAIVLGYAVYKITAERSKHE